MAAVKGDGDALETLIGAKASDSAVVHLTGAETITGAKTFSSTIIGSISGNAGTVNGHTVAVDVLGEATAAAAGLMSSADKSKLDGLGSVFNFCGSVADAVSLPSSGNSAGDVYAVESPASVWAWDGTAWVELGFGDFLVPIASAQIDALFE